MSWVGEGVRVPVPNAKVYLCASSALVAASLYHAVANTKEPGGADPARSTLHRAGRVATYMLQEPACVWVNTLQ